MGVWDYTGLVVILMLIYYNKDLRKKIKSMGKLILDIIENGLDL